MAGAGRVPDSWFLVKLSEIEGDRLRLSAEESRHLLRVFRAAPGTRFEATDGSGGVYRCVLESADGATAVGRIESRARDEGELPFSIGLLVGLPEAAQAETIVEQATALGASRITFATTVRSGPERLNPARLSRLQRVAAAAMKQSRRSRLPEIRGEELPAALEGLGPAGWRLLAHLDAPGRVPGGVMGGESTIQLAVGPPGGFLREEVERIEAVGFARISLGPTRLTTSTAALCLTVWSRNCLLFNHFR